MRATLVKVYLKSYNVFLSVSADTPVIDRFEYGKILKDMHTSLYEDVGSKYGLERGDSIDGRNVQHLHKRDYIRKLAKEAKQAEKAVKGLQSMIRNLESKVFSYNQQLEKAEQELVSGRITLDRYKEQKAEIQKLIAEYQTKLEDKAGKLHAKEQEYAGYSRQGVPEILQCFPVRICGHTSHRHPLPNVRLLHTDASGCCLHLSPS